MTPDLDLAPIGNSAISALIDREGRFVWCCAPRVDSDPIFSSLLSGRDPAAPDAQGLWAIDVANANTLATIRCLIRTGGTGGTIIPRFNCSGVAASAVVKVDSVGLSWELD